MANKWRKKKHMQCRAQHIKEKKKKGIRFNKIFCFYAQVIYAYTNEILEWFWWFCEKQSSIIHVNSFWFCIKMLVGCLERLAKLTTFGYKNELLKLPFLATVFFLCLAWLDFIYVLCYGMVCWYNMVVGCVEFNFDLEINWIIIVRTILTRNGQMNWPLINNFIRYFDNFIKIWIFFI